MFGITQQQKRVLDFITQFVEAAGYSPSYRDIQRGLEYKSTAGVKQIIDQLESRGRIRKSRKANSIQVIQKC